MPFLRHMLLWIAAATLVGAMIFATQGEAAEKVRKVERDYSRIWKEPAPVQQPGKTEGEQLAAVARKSDGCLSCHEGSDVPSMHETPAVQLGCVDCHGGDASVTGNPKLPYDSDHNFKQMELAHVLPEYPDDWHGTSANPKRSYTLLNRESPEFIRFMNPSDYRVVREACGACHMPIIEAGERSIMATGAMLWGGAAYNNGILPFKNYIVGESFTRDGQPAKILSPGAPPGTLTENQKARGALEALYPLPTWQVIPPGDVFRVFERGGRTINPAFPEIGLTNPTGSIQRLEEPGRPDLKQSNRGMGTGLRVAIPVLNIHKTRLNDPFMWYMGTNDQPGDYRHSGCAACHVVYANDREPRHSLTYAKYGRDGQSITQDPTICNKTEPKHDDAGHGGDHGGDHGEAKGHGDDAHGDANHAGEPSGHGALRQPAGGKCASPEAIAEAAAKADNDPAGAIASRREKGHPLKHVFTRSIPTAQCMNCHMHQPNIFLNSYLGYTMWDYESDAPFMWPKQQKYPTAEEVRAVTDRNPEGASPKGSWADIDFLRNVYDLNPQLKHTQFADYHGHGWNFRAIFKRDREGNLLDKDDNIIPHDDPEKWRKEGEGKFVDVKTNPGKSVHMMDIHAEKGMQCADCHFAQDSHGNGMIYGEVANAIEIGCKDCHGTADAYPTLRTSGPAAPPKGHDLSLLRNPDGQRRFEWVWDDNGQRALVQRSIIDPKLSWTVSLTKDSTDPDSPYFNAKSARAKLVSADSAGAAVMEFGPDVPADKRAHRDEEMACFTCHLSWTTSCGGCHLPIEANWKTKDHHYENGSTRNFATYNPQVARDEMFQLGKHQTTKGNQIAPVRSTSALVLSSTNINRERIYVQQPPISSSGYSSQAFAPHFPHTVRKTETKKCSDCHISDQGDNNAIMAQTLLLGTNFVNFVGLNAWTGQEGGFEAIRVTEWDEPQAVLGSYLHKYAYPDYYNQFVDDNGRELKNWVRGKTFDENLSGETQAYEEFANVHEGTSDRVGCLQLRGEYMFVAEGRGGFRVYDVASIANKGVSERIITAPFSSMGHDTHVKSVNATCMALATNQPINPLRNTKAMQEANQEQPFLPIYNYAVISDSEEGMILVNVNTMADGEFRNNKLERFTFANGQTAWNENGVLTGARHVTLAGEVAYFSTDRGLVMVDLKDPANPVAKLVDLPGAKSSAVQFRYLWVADGSGLKLFDVTDLRNPVPVTRGNIAIPGAQRLYLARTYAYVAAKSNGLVIVDMTKPEAPVIYRKTQPDGQPYDSTLGGRLIDTEDVIVASTNASLFAYVADGRGGMKVLQLTSPDSQPNFYGFSPAPMPEIIAWAKTKSPAIAMSKGLDRDRAVDETGGQMAVFGRLGSRPFNREEMEKLFKRGEAWTVSDQVDMRGWVGKGGKYLRADAKGSVEY